MIDFPATAGTVGALGGALVDLHGQHEHQTLLRSADQRTILDAYGGAGEAARRVSTLHAELHELERALDERESRARDVESRADFLRFQLSEIDELRIAPGEDEALEGEAQRHEHAEELIQGVGSVHEVLYAADDALVSRLHEARRTLERLAAVDPELASDVRLLEEAGHALTEVGRRAGDYASAVEHDPERLEAVRERLDKLFRLKRKYGPELADVLATAQRVRGELADLDESDHDLELLEKRIEDVDARLAAAARDISAARREASGRLGAAVAAVLPDLGLAGASFEVRLSPLEGVSAGGAESVEFLVAPNPGFDAMPLARIASGGELSRVMLALKSILAAVDRVPVLVFDEIDAGVGGVIASAVAEKLVEVAGRHQVFVVSHLAQVASRAKTHFLVEKGAGDGVTSAGVRALSGEDRVEEIARMLGGDPESTKSREHARELLGAVSGLPRSSGRSGRRARPVS